MTDIDLDRVCFFIGSRPVYWYGVMMALAFVAGILHWTLVGRKRHRDAAYAADLAFWIMVGGIVGARLAYVIANLHDFAQNPLAIVRIDQGGLIYYGGLIGGALAVVLFARARRESLLELGDFVLGALPLGHALGRVGCFLNGCCYGVESPSPWGVMWRGVMRVPVQLYESSANLLIYGFLLVVYLRTRGKPPGRIIALYLLTYPVVRFFLEFLRGDEREHWGAFTVAQAVSLGMFTCGALLWIALRQRHGRIPRSP